MSNSRIISNEMMDMLKKFSVVNERECTLINGAAKKLLRDIQTINQLDEQQQPKRIDILRTDILGIVTIKIFPTIFIKNVDFKNFLCEILVKLAEQFHINSIDSETGFPEDLESYHPIEKNDQFYSIIGQIFSITTIIKYNKRREADDVFGETPQGKYLFNPHTKRPFLAIDMERFIIIATKKNQNLDFIIDKHCHPTMGGTTFSQPFTLKNLVSMANGIALMIDLDLERELKYSPDDAMACIVACARHQETQTFAYLYDHLELPYKNLLKTLTIPDKFIIEESSANAFIYLLAMFNEPLTLRKISVLGINLNTQIQFGVSAIHVAAQHGSDKAMEVLLDPKYNVKVNLRTSSGETAVNLAARYQHLHIVEMLVRKGANLMIPRYDGKAPIHMAAIKDNVELMRYLLIKRVNLDQTTGPLGLERTAAHLAARHNSKRVTEMLLEAGADFTKMCEEGFTPLHHAAFYGSVDVMYLLLQHRDKISPDIVAHGKFPHTVAIIAAENGHVPILKLLAESNVALDNPRADNGTTPLHRAIFSGHYAASVFLIDHYLSNHKNIFAKDKVSGSPFFAACMTQKWEFAKLFLNKVNDKDIPEEDKKLMEIYREELGLVTNKNQAEEKIFSATKSALQANHFQAAPVEPPRQSIHVHGKIRTMLGMRKT